MLMNTCKFLFLFFFLSAMSCASENPADVAYEFLNEYYAVKDIRKVEKYLHKDLLVLLDSDNKRTARMWESANRNVEGWSDFEFKFLSETKKENSVIISLNLIGVKDGSPSERKVSVEMKKDEYWKVYALR